MNFLILGGWSVLPGAWFAFSRFCSDLNWRSRVALAIVLSPAVLGVQFLALKSLGIGFAYVAPLLVVVNLPSFLLVLPYLRWPPRPRHWKLLLLASVVLLIVVGYVAAPWLLVPQYRPFAWHALWHTDIIYELTRSVKLPEEPEIAGLRLSYAWAGHIYWSLVGWFTNWPPTLLYPLSNLIWVGATFVLAYELGRTGFMLHPLTAILALGLLFFGTDIVPVTIWLLTDDPYRWGWILGDLRTTTLLNKFHGFETMPFAYALLVGLALVCLSGMQRHVKHLGVIATVLLSSLGLLYPILFPMGCLLVGALIFLLWTRWADNLPHYRGGELVSLVIGAGISLVLFLTFLAVVTQDRSGGTAEFVTQGRVSKSLHVISALAPFGLLGLPLIVQAVRKRHGPTLLLTVTSVCLAILYVFASVDGLEYKFILGAAIVLAPLAALGLERLFLRSMSSRWIAALAVPGALAAINLLFLFHFGVLIPTNLDNAPQVMEDSFWLALAPAEQDAAWTNRVREATPSETVVVSYQSKIHLGPFVNRSLYIPSDLDGVATSGYSVPNDYNMIEWRGYSEQLYAERAAVVETLYKESDPAALARSLQALMLLKRPVAIHFADINTPALIWMREDGIGQELYADQRNVVWLIEPGAVVSNSLQSQVQ